MGQVRSWLRSSGSESVKSVGRVGSGISGVPGFRSYRKDMSHEQTGLGSREHRTQSHIRTTAG